MGEAVKAVVVPVDPAAAGPSLAGGAARLLPGRAGVLQVPAERRLRRRAAARAQREAVQTPPSWALLGWAHVFDCV